MTAEEVSDKEPFFPGKKTETSKKERRKNKTDQKKVAKDEKNSAFSKNAKPTNSDDIFVPVRFSRNSSRPELKLIFHRNFVASENLGE